MIQYLVFNYEHESEKETIKWKTYYLKDTLQGILYNAKSRDL